MSDFFGGILDDIRGIGDDVSGFFDTTLGSAVGKGIIGLTKKDESKKGGPSLSDGFVDVGGGNFQPRSRGEDLQSEDYSSAEIEWLKRLHKFASLDTGTDVKLGGK